jgi:hypothetical protein
MVGEAIGREEVLRAARAQRAMRRWEEVVGPMLATKSSPDKYDHGTLWVAVTGSAWAQELRMVKNQILGKLRNIAGDPELFTDIRFGVRPIAPVPVPVEESPLAQIHRDSLQGLSVTQIKERRLKKWQDEGGS